MSGPARGIRFDPLSRADGVPEDTFDQVLQDRRGFIWFTTGQGLVRYDGYEHVVYRGLPTVRRFGQPAATPGLLHEDRDGNLWVGADALYRFDPATGAFSLVLSLPAGALRPDRQFITAIHDGPGGTLWMGIWASVTRDNRTREVSEPALYQADPARRTVIRHPMSAEIAQNRPVAVYAIQEDKERRLWLGTSIGLMRFDPSSRSFQHYPHTHPDAFVESRRRDFNGLAWDKSGRLWVHVPAGLDRFDPRTGKFDRFVETRFTRMTQDPSGRIWLWSNGLSGPQVFDPSQPAESALKTVPFLGAFGQSLESMRVDGFGVDRQGNVWASPQIGSPVQRYSPALTKFGSYVPNPMDPDSLSGGEIMGFAEDAEGAIWIASNIAGLNKFEPASGNFIRHPGNPNNPKALPTEIDSIHIDRSGVLWIGASTGTVGRLDRKSGRYTHVAKLKYSITSMFEDSTGRFWVGGMLGPLQLVDRSTGAVTPMSPRGGYLTYEDRQGNLWFGFPPGLTKLDRAGDVRAVRIREPDAANRSALMVRSIYEDPDGTLWVASNRGIYALDPRTEKAIAYSVDHGLPTEDVSCMLPDRDGNLWLSTDQGISRFSISEKRFYNFDERDGLQGRTFNSYVVLRRAGRQALLRRRNRFQRLLSARHSGASA